MVRPIRLAFNSCQHFQLVVGPMGVAFNHNLLSQKAVNYADVQTGPWNHHWTPVYTNRIVPKIGNKYYQPLLLPCKALSWHYEYIFPLFAKQYFIVRHKLCSQAYGIHIQPQSLLKVQPMGFLFNGMNKNSGQAHGICDLIHHSTSLIYLQLWW